MRDTPLNLIIENISRYRASYIDVLIQENLIGSRFKSDDSILRKYDKTIRSSGGFKQCFNDILGFRLRFENYPENYPEYYRVVDLRKGKKADDGYHAIHLYYQRDNMAYQCKTINEARCIPGTLEALRADDVQIVIWDDPDIYSEYAPYSYVEDLKEFMIRLPK